VVFEGFDVLQDGHRLTKRGIEGRNGSRQAGRPVFKNSNLHYPFLHI
jgi:hypothetical protein